MNHFGVTQLSSMENHTVEFLNALSLRMPKHLASTGQYFKLFFQKENWSKINWGIHQGVSQSDSETCLRIETGTLSPIPSLKMRLWNSALLEVTVFWTFLCDLSSHSWHQCTISIYLWGEFIKQHLGNWERLRTPSWNRFCNSFVIFYPGYTWIFLKACKIEYDNRKIPCS